MTHELDLAKLEQLFEDLGRNKVFLRELAAAFRSQCENLATLRQANSPQLADTVHQIAGSSAMLAPASLVKTLNLLEDEVRKGHCETPLFDTMVADLTGTASLVEEWIEQLPDQPNL